MKREDLFLAIGAVEESRLARCENNGGPSDVTHWEDKDMGKYERTRTKKVIRGLLIAAVVMTLVATTAFAAAAYLLYENPEELLNSIFGDNTGFDHSEGSIRPDPWGSPEAILVEPTFDRVPADEAVVAEDIAPYVSPVGQSVSWKGYTLTVDAFLYDSTTQCGFVTYLLENTEGVSDYNLQTDGEIWYEKGQKIVDVNQYGHLFIIQEKTTDTCLAATYYFKWDPSDGEDLDIGFYYLHGYSAKDLALMQTELVERFKKEMTEEEALSVFKENVGQELYEEVLGAVGQEEFLEVCYAQLAVMEQERQLEEAACKDVITVSCENATALDCLKLKDGNIAVSPISLRIDTTGLGLTRVDGQGNAHTDTNEVDSIVIRYRDGSEYTVFAGHVTNYMFSLKELPEDNVTQQVFVPAEEDPMGEGYYQTVNSREYCVYTMMFNRIINIDDVAAVIINGTVFPVE